MHPIIAIGAVGDFGPEGESPALPPRGVLAGTLPELSRAALPLPGSRVAVLRLPAAKEGPRPA
jgi:hypothetical protein